MSAREIAAELCGSTDTVRAHCGTCTGSSARTAATRPCTDEDKDYSASVVRTFAHHVDDIRLTLHQNSQLGLAAARRAAALLGDTATCTYRQSAGVVVTGITAAECADAPACLVEETT